MNIKAIILKKVHQASIKIIDEIYIYQDKDKIVFQAMGHGSSILLEIIHRTKCKKLDVPIVIKSSKLKNVVSVLNDDDDLETILEDEYITFKTKRIKRRIRTYVPEKPRFEFPDERKDEPLVFTHSFEIYSSGLRDAINSSKDVGGYITIRVFKTKMVLYRKDALDDFNYQFNNEDITMIKSPKEIENYFNEKYIEDIASSIDGNMLVKIGGDHPIKITSDVLDNLKIKYMLAPLVKLDE